MLEHGEATCVNMDHARNGLPVEYDEKEENSKQRLVRNQGRQPVAHQLTQGSVVARLATARMVYKP